MVNKSSPHGSIQGAWYLHSRLNPIAAVAYLHNFHKLNDICQILKHGYSKKRLTAPSFCGSEDHSREEVISKGEITLVDNIQGGH